MKAGRELDALIAEKVMDGWVGPCYSTDIAAAWLVVEKLHELAYPFEMNRDHKDRWFIHGTLNGQEDCLGFGYSAPEAICRAALRVVGVEV